MNTVEPKLPLPADRTLCQKPSIWVSVAKLVSKHKPHNLGQGFPDFLPRTYVLQNLQKTSNDSCDTSLHQLTRLQGHPRLVQALSAIYSPLFCHDAEVSGACPPELRAATFSPSGGHPHLKGKPRLIDPEREIIISHGGYGSLSAAFLAFVNPGDEVLVIEPAFDCYVPMIHAVGAKPVFVALRPPAQVTSACIASDWVLDFDELESKITPRTKVLIFNTPNNPLGKVFSISEMKRVADICIRHNLICFADEVYEWLVFPPFKHIKMASLPGMWERTVTIGSAGKTFNITGWKTGWTLGPENLISAMEKIQENTIEACPTPIQEAVATSLEVEIPLMNTPQSYFRQIVGEVSKKVSVLAKGLEIVGMQPMVPQGGYFVVVNIENVALPPEVAVAGDGEKARDVIFNEWMLVNKKLNGIPVSAFYCDENKKIGEKFLRFCAIKDEKTLESAIELLKKW